MEVFITKESKSTLISFKSSNGKTQNYYINTFTNLIAEDDLLKVIIDNGNIKEDILTIDYDDISDKLGTTNLSEYLSEIGNLDYFTLPEIIGSGGGSTDAGDLISGILPIERIANNSITESKLDPATVTKLNSKQSLSLTGNTLGISDGNTVDLSGLGGSGISNTKSISEYGFSPTSTRTENVTSWEAMRQDHIAGNVTNLTIPDGTYNIDGILSIQGLNGLIIKATRNAVISTNADLPIFKTELNADGCINTNFGQLKLESTLSVVNNRLVNPGLIFVGGSPFTNNVLSGMEATAPNTAINFFFSANEGAHETSNNTFTYNYIHDIGRIGIEITNHTEGAFRFNNNDISHNTVDGVGLVTGNDGTFPIAISLSGQGLYNTVTFNSVKNASRDLSGTLVGIAIENVGASYTQIVNNSFGENVDHPFSLSNEFPMYGVNISGNTSSYDHTNKSILENVSNVRLSNNRILGGLNIRNSENITIDNDKWTDSGFGTLAISNNPNVDLDFVGVKNVKIKNSSFINTQASGVVIYQSGDGNEGIEIIDSYLEHEGGRYSHQGGTSLEPAYIHTRDVRVGISDEILNPYGSDATVDGSNVSFTPTATITDDNVQDAIEKVATLAASPWQRAPSGLDRWNLSGRLGVGVAEPQKLVDLRNGTAKLYLSDQNSNILFFEYYQNSVARQLDFRTGMTSGAGIGMYNDFPIINSTNVLKLQGVGGVDITNGLTVDGVRVPNKTVGTTAERPTTPTIGDEHFDTDLGYRIDFNGTNWVDGTGTIR